MTEIPIELILKAKSGDQESINEVVKRSEKLIKYFMGKSLKRKPRQFDFYSLLQEGYIGVWKALKDYDPNQSKFITYAGNRIKWRVGWEITKTNKDKYFCYNKKEPNLYSVEQVEESINCLDDRSQRVIKQRFGIGCDPKKLREIAVKLRISSQMVHLIEKKALQTIKTKLMGI